MVFESLKKLIYTPPPRKNLKTQNNKQTNGYHYDFKKLLHYFAVIQAFRITFCMLFD